jgi:hypothetical protein
MPVEFEPRSWPLLLVRLAGQDTDESIEALLVGLSHHLSRGRCAVLIDTTEVVYPPLQDSQRWTRQQGNWLRNHRELVARNCCGVGFVMISPTVRFILTGILLIAPLPCEHIVVPTALEARAFCEARLRANQLIAALPGASLPAPAILSTRKRPPKVGS